MTDHPDTSRFAYNDDLERLKIIMDTLEAVRPGMLADGGDVELVAVEGHKVKVRLHGACASCEQVNSTLGGIRRTLMQALGGGPVLVVPAAAHSGGCHAPRPTQLTLPPVK